MCIDISRTCRALSTHLHNSKEESSDELEELHVVKYILFVLLWHRLASESTNNHGLTGATAPHLAYPHLSPADVSYKASDILEAGEFMDRNFEMWTEWEILLCVGTLV